MATPDELSELLYQSQLTNTILLFVVSVAVGALVCVLLYKFFNLFF